MPTFATRTAFWLRPSGRTAGNSEIIFLILFPKAWLRPCFSFLRAGMEICGADKRRNHIPTLTKLLPKGIDVSKKMLDFHFDIYAITAKDDSLIKMPDTCLHIFRNFANIAYRLCIRYLSLEVYRSLNFYISAMCKNCYK